MSPASVLLLIGALIALLVNFAVGVALIVVGIVLIFVPQA